MKKVIYLLVLCMVLGMAGCGTNQENKEPVSGNVSVETENKENDDVVQNEQIADTGSYPPCVMVDGVIYKDTGYILFLINAPYLGPDQNPIKILPHRSEPYLLQPGQFAGPQLPSELL